MRRKKLGNSIVKKAITIAMALMMGISTVMASSVTVRAEELPTVNEVVEEAAEEEKKPETVDASQVAVDVNAVLDRAEKEASDVVATIVIGDVNYAEKQAHDFEELAEYQVGEAETIKSDAEKIIEDAIAEIDKLIEEGNKDMAGTEPDPEDERPVADEDEIQDADDNLVEEIDNANDILNSEAGFTSSAQAATTIEELTKDRDAAQEEYDEAAAALEAAEAELKAAEEALAKADQKSDEETLALTEKLEDAKKSMDKAVANATKAKERVDKVDKLLKDASATLEGWKENIDKSYEEVSTKLEESKKNLEEAIDELKESGSNAAGKLENFKKEFEELADSVKTLYEDIKQAEKEKKDVKDLYAKYEEALKAYNEAVEALKEAGLDNKDYNLDEAVKNLGEFTVVDENGTVVTEATGLAKVVEDAKKAADDAYKAVESYDTDYMKTVNDLKEEIKAAETKEETAELVEKLAVAVLEKEVIPGKKYEKIEKGVASDYGKSDDSDMYVVVNENGSIDAYAYTYENGVVSIYKMDVTNNEEYVVVGNNTVQVQKDGNYKYYEVNGKKILIDENNNEVRISFENLWYKNEYLHTTSISANNCVVEIKNGKLVLTGVTYVSVGDWTGIVSGKGIVDEEVFVRIKADGSYEIHSKFNDGIGVTPTKNSLNVVRDDKDNVFTLTTVSETTSDKYTTAYSDAVNASALAGEALDAAGKAYDSKKSEYEAYKAKAEAQAKFEAVDLGALKDLPVDLTDVFLKSNIDSFGDVKELGEALTELATGDDILAKLDAFTTVVSYLGINPIDDAEMWTAFMGAYLWSPEAADGAVDLVKKGVEAIDLIPSWIMSDEKKEAAKASIIAEAEKAAGLGDKAIRTKHQYAVEWTELVKARAEVVKAGFDVAKETVDTSKAGVELIVAAADVTEKTVVVALDSLKTAILAGTATALEISSKSLDLANTLVKALDKQLGKLQKETDEAYASAVAAQKTVEYLLNSVSKIDEEKLQKAQEDLDAANDKYKGLKEQLKDLKEDIDTANELLKEIQGIHAGLVARESYNPGSNDGGRPSSTPTLPTQPEVPAPIMLAAATPVTPVAAAPAEEVEETEEVTEEVVAEVEIAEEETPLAEEPETVEVAEEETPLASIPEEAKKTVWWWWILAVIAAATAGLTTYYVKKKKALEVEAKEPENK